MSGRPGRARGGFTLAELLASLALIGAVLPAALAGVTLAMGLSDTARHRTEAATLARGTLAEMMATGQWQGGEATGDFGDEWPGYSWALEVADWEEPTCSQVTLTVLWTSRGSERAVSLSTLAYAGGE